MSGNPHLQSLEVWFVTGSQHRYGNQALAQMAENSRRFVDGERQITVRFRATGGNETAAVYGIRVIRANRKRVPDPQDSCVMRARSQKPAQKE